MSSYPSKEVGESAGIMRVVQFKSITGMRRRALRAQCNMTGYLEQR